VTKVKITKEKRHSQRLASKVKKDSQTIHQLHQNIDDQLCKSEVQVIAADERYRNQQCKSEVQVIAANERYRKLKREYNAAINDIKIRHRSTLRQQQIHHAQIID
jgi:hypothetical protein